MENILHQAVKLPNSLLEISHLSMGANQGRLEEGVEHILLKALHKGGLDHTDGGNTAKAQYSHVVSEEFLLENIHPSTVDEDKLHQVSEHVLLGNCGGGGDCGLDHVGGGNIGKSQKHPGVGNEDHILNRGGTLS